MPFECGIYNVVYELKPVRVRFFLLRVVFLIFDVELILIYPIFLTLFKFFTYSGIILFMVLIFVITWGLLWEWAQSVLDWRKYYLKLSAWAC